MFVFSYIYYSHYCIFLSFFLANYHVQISLDFTETAEKTELSRRLSAGLIRQY